MTRALRSPSPAGTVAGGEAGDDLQMILSHKHKFIFLKTTKTAGTSVEISLSRYCGDDDVITPISAADEVIRQGLGCFPRNYLRPARLAEMTARDLARWVCRRQHPTRERFWNHMTAAMVRAEVGEEIWRSYFKFCFVRNPWDRAISRFHWNTSRGQNETLDESLLNNDPNSNFGIYTINGELAVDYVGKYETLLADLQTVCKKLQLPFDGWLPQAKSGSRTDRRPYPEVLSPAQMDSIRRSCAREIEWFGYE